MPIPAHVRTVASPPANPSQNAHRESRPAVARLCTPNAAPVLPIHRHYRGRGFVVAASLLWPCLEPSKPPPQRSRSSATPLALPKEQPHPCCGIMRPAKLKLLPQLHVGVFFFRHLRAVCSSTLSVSFRNSLWVLTMLCLSGEIGGPCPRFPFWGGGGRSPPQSQLPGVDCCD